MLKKSGKYAAVLALPGLSLAEEVSSSSGFLDLPDTLSAELINVAKDGFWHGFEIATACMLSMGVLVVAMYLINRAAGH